jgi:hypothetical protein
MNNIDIISLIEKNPITKLSNTYNNKLLIKIKEKFTDAQQQLFIASFYTYLNYNKNDFIIDLDNIWLWLGFSQKIRAKELLEKHFIININYKIINLNEKKIGRGGNNKERILLNIKTFKSFCLKASTKKASEIHEYFLNLEELLQEVINDETDEIKKQLEIKDNESNGLKKQLQNKDIELSTTQELEREKTLLKKFGKLGPLIYIIKVKSYENSSYVIKIGESREGVAKRYTEHKKNYEEILLLDCFLVKKSKAFEKYIHEKFRDYKMTTLVGHEKENELILIGGKLTYAMVIKEIEDNLKNYDDYNDNEIQKLEFENEKLKLELINAKSSNPIMNTNNDEILKILLENNKILSEEINEIKKSNKEILEKLNTIQCKTTNNFNEPLVNVGPRLQQINPETMELVKYYETVAECLKTNIKLKRPSIDKAINDNTVYNGYRWLYVARELDPNVIHKIEETKNTKIQNIGYIAKVNKDKTEIINVYLDRKTAAKFNNYKSDSALDYHVKYETITNEHYYILFDKCEEKLKKDFIEKNNGEPILYKDGIGQFDDTNKLVKEFICKNDCCRRHGISEKSLKKALEKGVMYNNHYYKQLGSKIKCF